MESGGEFVLSNGVTFETLEDTEFSKNVGTVKNGYVRILPYNQVDT